MARIQKKRLDTPVNEGGWSIGLGGLKLGNLLGGLNLHTDSKGNRKLGGNLRAKPFGSHGPSVNLGTDDLGQWSKKKRPSNTQTSKSSNTQTSKSSKQTHTMAQHKAARTFPKWQKSKSSRQKSNRELQGHN